MEKELRLNLKKKKIEKDLKKRKGKDADDGRKKRRQQ